MQKLKALIGILIIAGAFYYGWNMIPPYFRNYQFQDDLDDIARVATYNVRSDEDLKQAVISKAKAREIMLKEDQITITRIATGVGIRVHYRVHVEMIVHPTDIDFTADSKNMNIIAGSS
jgi:hypothetical protein